MPQLGWGHGSSRLEAVTTTTTTLEHKNSNRLSAEDRDAHTAAKHLGRRYGLCVALGHASRRMDRESFYADLRFSLVIPVGIDFEIYIVDKLARHMMPRLDAWEKDLADLTEEVWAEKLFDNLIAACDDEIDKNNEYWANRQQAQLYEDQQEFLRMVEEKKKNKNK